MEKLLTWRKLLQYCLDHDRQEVLAHLWRHWQLGNHQQWDTIQWLEALNMDQIRTIRASDVAACRATHTHRLCDQGCLVTMRGTPYRRTRMDHVGDFSLARGAIDRSGGRVYACQTSGEETGEIGGRR